MKILILGNCQANPISSLIFQSNHSVNVISRSIWDDKDESFRLIDESDIIITQPLNNNYYPISLDNIKEKYSNKLVTIHNLYFSGLLPDMCYCRDADNKDILAPMGSYSSRIIFYAYSLKKTEEECYYMFSPRWYDKLGYYNAWNNNLKELERREEKVSVPFCSEINDYSKKMYSFYSFNHPKNFLLVEYVKKICKYIGLAHDFYPGECHSDFLADFRWPIYKSIGEYHNLSYSTPMRFWWNRVPREITLPEYIHMTYECYNQNISRYKINQEVIDDIILYWTKQRQ